MRALIKPRHLKPGDLVATVSPCWGLAGDPLVRWKYDLGVSRLKELGLRVVAAPNSMRGSDYLAETPKARARHRAFDRRAHRDHGALQNSDQAYSGRL